ncbi:hypothetical protein BgiBS90_018430 [Biomphalaria glabrata]|nr:hypothetical protein BgiBS90_018430 [Biomphalaria glabrata]
MIEIRFDTATDKNLIRGENQATIFLNEFSESLKVPVSSELRFNSGTEEASGACRRPEISATLANDFSGALEGHTQIDLLGSRSEFAVKDLREINIVKALNERPSEALEVLTDKAQVGTDYDCSADRFEKKYLA